MRPNPELLLVKALNDSPQLKTANLTAHLNVPETRPPQFITLELVGHRSRNQIDYAALAVQVWAGGRVQAAKLAQTVAIVLQELAFANPHIGGVEVESIYNFPDPDSRQARYQLTVTISVVA